MSQVKLVVMLIFAFLLVLVTVVNQPQVSMNFLFWKTPEVSLIVFVFASILLGVIFATILGALAQLKLRKEISKKEKESKELKEKVVKLELALGKFEQSKENQKAPPEMEPLE